MTLKRGCGTILAAVLFLAGCARPPEIYRAVPSIAPLNADSPFIMPRSAEDPPLWGIDDGIVVGLHPAVVGFARQQKGGPRGLLRIGFVRDGQVFFINFLALSPVTHDRRRGMSELDLSPTDNRPGMLIDVYPPEFHEQYARWGERPPPSVETAARVTGEEAGRRTLELVLRYERFDNGAEPYLVVKLSEARPREVEFSFYTEPGSAPLRMCVLSSTFGNLTRQRDLYLADGIVNAGKLWPDYRGNNFARAVTFSLEKLAVNRRGDVVFAARPDEENPWEDGAYPHPLVLTQYFRKPAAQVRDDLQGLVNGRFAFWRTTTPVPGGLSFENVALVEGFRQGAILVFGYHEGDPAALFE